MATLPVSMDLFTVGGCSLPSILSEDKGDLLHGSDLFYCFDENAQVRGASLTIEVLTPAEKQALPNAADQGQLLAITFKAESLPAGGNEMMQQHLEGLAATVDGLAIHSFQFSASAPSANI